MGLYEDAKSNWFLAGAVAVVVGSAALVAGWKAHEALSTVGERKVIGGAYEAKVVPGQPGSGFISQADYDALVREKNAIGTKLNSVQQELDELRMAQNGQDGKQEARSQLLNAKADIEARLKLKRSELLMCSKIKLVTEDTRMGDQKSSYPEACAKRERDALYYEERLNDVDKKIVDLH